MIRDGQIICDGCAKVITRITDTPADWAPQHNLCPSCFQALWKTSIPPA